MQRFEDGVRFQLSQLQPILSGPITNIRMNFNDAETVITEGHRYFVQAVRTTAHGDDRTQSTRKEFMGLEKDHVGKLVGIFDNMYGRWRIVQRADGHTAHVDSRDLKMISETLFQEHRKLLEVSKRVKEAKPAQFSYTTNVRDIPTLVCDNPIVPNSVVSIRVDTGYRTYSVRTVYNRFSLVDGVAIYAGTEVVLDSI